jgi:hypothetical protein
LRLCLSSTNFPPSSPRNFRLIPLVSTPFRLIPDKKINFLDEIGPMFPIAVSHVLANLPLNKKIFMLNDALNDRLLSVIFQPN